jgi:cytochrome c556
VVDYRKNNMKIIGGHMGSIAAIVKGEVDQKEQLAVHAKGMAEMSALVKSAFEAKVLSGKSTSKAEIWSDWNKFSTAADNFQNAAQELAEAAAKGEQRDIRTAMAKVGKSCKSCHDDFKSKN